MNDINHFISTVDSISKQSDSKVLLALLEKASGYKPMLSGSIIGFGKYHYQYDSGREGDAAVIAFSPRKQNLVVYIMPGFTELEDLLSKLGKYKLGKSCLYINKLSDINLSVLEDVAKLSVTIMQKKYSCTST